MIKKIALTITMFSLLSVFAVAQTHHNRPQSGSGRGYDYYRQGNYTPYYRGYNSPGSYYSRGSSNYGNGFYYGPYGSPNYPNFPSNPYPFPNYGYDYRYSTPMPSPFWFNP